MPIYEYQCSICGHQLEELQSMTDQPLMECPTCHQPGLNKLISAAGFQLKGTGWYKTDYSAKGKAKPAQETESNTNGGGTEKKTTEANTQEASSNKATGPNITPTKDGTKSS
jgi:putative FmdB family regulatory protein